MITKDTKPKGRVPNHVKGFLEANGDSCWPLLVCPKGGKWVDGIDHFAPYHNEMNYCKKCDGKPKTH